MSSFFSRRKKGSPSVGSPLSIHQETVSAGSITPPTPPPVPTIRLRVAVDPLPAADGTDKDLFYIYVNPDADVSAIRRQVVEKLGNVSTSLFKVSIPWQAYYQARAYTERYASSVNLVTAFPSYCLDDPTQLAIGLGPAGWGLSLEPGKSPKIRDWFPEAVNAESDIISVLVRTAHGSSSNTVPITFLAHFAAYISGRMESPRDSPRVGAAVPSSQRLPAVVDISPEATVDQLKAALLRADERANVMLDKVILWRVEMSKEEMVVIDQRGGLKGGQMPWPYPPTAPVPVALEDGSKPISHYFPATQSNCRMVNLSVWIHPSAATALSRMVSPESIDAPMYQYPMVVSERLCDNDRHRMSAPSGSPPLSQGVMTLGAWPPGIAETSKTIPRASKRSSRGRPSTAPAVIVSPESTPKVPTFGSKSFPRPQSISPNIRAISPLATNSVIASPPMSSSPEPRGLGISTTTTTITQSIEQIQLPSLSTSPDISDEEFTVPSLSFARLTMTLNDASHDRTTILLTPEIEKSGNDWLMPSVDYRQAGGGGGGVLKKAASLSVTIGSEHRKNGRISGIFRKPIGA